MNTLHDADGGEMKIPADLENRLRPVTDVFIAKRKFDVALETLLKIKNDFPHQDVVDYYLGICQVNLNRFQKAAETFTQIRESKNITLIQLLQVNLILGLIFTEENLLDEAEKCFRKALLLNAQSSMAESALGYIFYLRGQYEAAIRSFRRALELNPNNAGAHNNLGYTLAEIGLNLSEAVRECRKAVALSPLSAAYHDSLGYAYFVSGQFGDSVVQLRKALDLAPANPEIQGHLEAALRKRDRR